MAKSNITQIIKSKKLTNYLTKRKQNAIKKQSNVLSLKVTRKSESRNAQACSWYQKNLGKTKI